MYSELSGKTCNLYPVTSHVVSAKFAMTLQCSIPSRDNRRFHLSREQSEFGVNEAPKTIVVNGNHMEFCCYFSVYWLKSLLLFHD